MIILHFKKARNLRLFLLFLILVEILAWNIPLPNGGRISYNNGVLRIGLEDMSILPKMPSPKETISSTILEAIEIRDTGTVKGFGAFCTSPIDRNEFLGFYEGEKILLNLDYDADNTYIYNGEYIVALDGGKTFLDGYNRAQNRDVFTPAHLNHKDKQYERCNCLRILEGDKVAFFTKRLIEEGEELCFDYGSNYWIGRESEKI
mmetsp:Transcript_28043/g.31033  ORF Transcript_28043/g.31033 Transcript_28043/m.31033 type:complete len:204 (+) Transcript_28043:96-707(+)